MLKKLSKNIQFPEDVCEKDLHKQNKKKIGVDKRGTIEYIKNTFNLM